MPQTYRAKIRMGCLEGRPFLELHFPNNSPYPVQQKKLVVPVIHESLDCYREAGAVELFLDFPNAIVPGGGLFEKSYDCRTNQAALLRDFETAVQERVEDALTCRPELFHKPEEFVFRSDAGVKKSYSGIPEAGRVLRAKPEPARYKGIGEE